MNFTRSPFLPPGPEDVLPLLECVAGILPHALRTGMAWADELQEPDVARGAPVDRHFLAHSARHRARRILTEEAARAQGWDIVPGVPNSAIHLRFGGLHVARVLRSSNGTTPAPGPNLARRQAWQQQLPLVGGGQEAIPPLSLVIDWHPSADGEPVMHVGLPRGVWNYRSDPLLVWRHPFPVEDILDLRFSPEPDDELDIILRIDDEERGAG